jgi:hypothetical protein
MHIGEESRSFQTFGMENNQTGMPTMNPRRFKVAMKGTFTFPEKGKMKGSPWEGVP